MVVGSMMTAERKRRIIADLEAQGATARETKKGILIYSPDGEGMRTISAISGDVKGLRDDIAWFRRHGLIHPADKKEQPKMGRSAATNEEGYPLYVVGPINGTTRKRVLAELEHKGWPLRIRPTELAMDTVTATRALYNVGYRWDQSTPAKSRVWIAPDDIKEMHERVKAEMERREQEAKEARAAAHATQEIAKVAVEEANAAAEEKEALVGHEGTEGHSMQVVRTDTIIGMVREAARANMIENPTPTEAAEAIENPKEPHKREFVDDVDSWTVEEMPAVIAEYLDALRGAGLEAEIRVWRKQ
jgi:hypothetical protein